MKRKRQVEIDFLNTVVTNKWNRAKKIQKFRINANSTATELVMAHKKFRTLAINLIKEQISHLLSKKTAGSMTTCNRATMKAKMFSLMEMVQW